MIKIPRLIKLYDVQNNIVISRKFVIRDFMIVKVVIKGDFSNKRIKRKYKTLYKVLYQTKNVAFVIKSDYRDLLNTVKKKEYVNE